MLFQLFGLTFHRKIYLAIYFIFFSLIAVVENAWVLFPMLQLLVVSGDSCLVNIKTISQS